MAGVWGLVVVQQPALRDVVRASPPPSVGTGARHCAMDVAQPTNCDVDGSEQVRISLRLCEPRSLVPVGVLQVS